MKRIIILSCLVASMAFVSCTNDEEDTVEKVKPAISADYPDTGGGQSGQTPIPPPKP